VIGYVATLFLPEQEKVKTNGLTLHDVDGEIG